MGLFDAPAPLFNWLDTQMGNVAPPEVRIAVWGIAGGVVSMLIYRAISAQDRVARAKLELAEARRDLDSYDGEFTGAWPLMKRLLGLALAQVGRVGWPAVIASLPLLCLLAWASTAFGYRYPPAGTNPDIETRPAGYQAQWHDPGSADAARASIRSPRIVVRDNSLGVIVDVALVEPVPVLHKRKWWNTLIANPAGYLPQEGSLNSIHVALPRREYLPFGFDWMRGWETAFFAPLLLASIALKILIRIE